MVKFLKIGTHSGTFHCDEALACAMLKCLPQYKNAEIVRSRDQQVLDGCDIVVDVGAEYNPENHRYDHHQRTFSLNLAQCNPQVKTEKWANRTKLSSAGLVYAHFGHQVLQAMVPESKFKPDELCSEYFTALYKFVYENLMEEVDAVDNGVDQWSGENLQRNYKKTTTLSSRVSNLNPSWLEENQDTDKIFPKAMEITKYELTDRINGFNSWWAARSIVKKAILERKEYHPSGKVIYFSQFCPWKAHVYAFEQDKNFKELSENEVLYCVFQGADSCRVQCVSVEGSFENRKSLPKSWRGIRNEELQKVTGLSDAVFCHAAGFISGWGSMESAKKAVEMALEE